MLEANNGGGPYSGGPQDEPVHPVAQLFSNPGEVWTYVDWPSLPHLLTVAETACILRCSKSSVLRKAHSGELTNVGTGRDMRFKKFEVYQVYSNQKA